MQAVQSRSFSEKSYLPPAIMNRLRFEEKVLPGKKILVG